MAQDMNAEPIGAFEEGNDPEPDEVPKRKRDQQPGRIAAMIDAAMTSQHGHNRSMSPIPSCWSAAAVAPYAPCGEEIDVEVMVWVHLPYPFDIPERM